MSAAPSPDAVTMQDRLSRVMAAAGVAGAVTGWQPVFGGNARRAYAFDMAEASGAHRPCILLSQQAGGHVASDTAAEHRVLRALNDSGVRAPRALALDDAGAITGSPALVMERMPGRADAVAFLRRAPPAGLALSEDLARVTGELHRFDWQAAGLTAPTGDPIRAQIDHWEAEFNRHRLEPHPVLAWLFRWLRAHAPRPARLALVHGDLRPGNFLYDDTRLVAMLDWEMAHVGDPAEDIAWIYRDLWSPERFLPLDSFLELHRASSGIEITRSTMTYYRIFSEAKFAAISLAAAHLFASGQTANLRHIDRAAKVPACLQLALGWIASEDWSTHHAAA